MSDRISAGLADLIEASVLRDASVDGAYNGPRRLSSAPVQTVVDVASLGDDAVRNVQPTEGSAPFPVRIESGGISEPLEVEVPNQPLRAITGIGSQDSSYADQGVISVSAPQNTPFEEVFDSSSQGAAPLFINTYIISLEAQVSTQWTFTLGFYDTARDKYDTVSKKEIAGNNITVRVGNVPAIQKVRFKVEAGGVEFAGARFLGKSDLIPESYPLFEVKAEAV